MFESIPDARVAHALLDAAAAWARARAKERLVGPIDYAIHYQSGLLVGRDHAVTGLPPLPPARAGESRSPRPARWRCG